MVQVPSVELLLVVVGDGASAEAVNKTGKALIKSENRIFK
jgi:hypothetical protein